MGPHLILIGKPTQETERSAPPMVWMNHVWRHVAFPPHDHGYEPGSSVPPPYWLRCGALCHRRLPGAAGCLRNGINMGRGEAGAIIESATVDRHRLWRSTVMDSQRTAGHLTNGQQLWHTHSPQKVTI